MLGIWKLANYLLCALVVWLDRVARFGAARDPRRARPFAGRSQNAGPPPVRAPNAVWPRLDPGAVVCQTEDDLDRHAANMIARVSGGEMQTANCRVIGQTVGIKIVNREGPGRTQVQLDRTRR